MLPNELIIGKDYILNFHFKNGELKLSCKGEFYGVHKKEFCTLFEFRNIISKFKTKKLLIDPYSHYIITQFYDAEQKTLQQICWNSITDEDKIWLKNHNHTYTSLAIKY